MTGSTPVHPAIPAFTVGFRARSKDKESIRKWLMKKVQVRRPDSIRKWLNAEIETAETTLIDLKPIKTHPDVELARRNVRAQLEWATSAKAELLRLFPNARSKFQPKRHPRRSARKRVGSLARETQVFGRDGPVSDS